jgi:hypothetical protein
MSCLLGLAEVAAAQQEFERVARLLAATGAQRVSHRLILNLREQRSEKVASLARAALGADAYRRAREGGCAMSLDEALALVLQRDHAG